MLFKYWQFIFADKNLLQNVLLLKDLCQLFEPLQVLRYWITATEP